MIKPVLSRCLIPFLLAIAIAFNVSAEENVTVNVTAPGNLMNQLDNNQVNDILQLTLIGEINGTDFLTINKCENLISLDLRKAKIVAGGLPYYNGYETKDNAIGESWAYNLKNLEYVNLPESLIEIGAYSFTEINIRDIIIPASVSQIEEGAFMNCKSLESVIILSEEITTISRSLFSGCENLKYFTIPESVTEIGEGAFKECSSLISLEIPDNVISIGWWAFLDCSALTDVRFGRSLRIIGNGAFSRCYNLTTVEFGPSLESIEGFAFNFCINLQDLKLPNSLKTIGPRAFGNNTSLTSVAIPFPVNTIGQIAFTRCTSLKSVELPGSLREIGRSAFSECENLESIKIINPIPPELGDDAFSDCLDATLYVPALSEDIYWLSPEWGKFKNISSWFDFSNPPLVFDFDNIAYRITSSYDNSVEIADATPLSSVRLLILPEEVEYEGKMYHVAGIANASFYNATDIYSLTLPASISYVGLDALRLCNKLNTINCYAEIPPSIGEDSFNDETFASASLNVISESVDEYSQNKVWGRFSVHPIVLPVTSIELNPGEWSGEAGDVFKIEATVYPLNSSNPSLYWLSSDETVATVNGEGLVTIHSSGYCEITARATDGSGVEAICKITSTVGIESVEAEIEGEIRVYNLAGQLIQVGYTNNLPKGVYIVRKSDRSKKIAI